MDLIRGLENLNRMKHPTAVTIGVFDGVHIGHQTIIKMAVDFARTIEGKSVVLTFDPHPLAVVRPESRPPLLTATDLKAEYIEKLGVDYMLVIPFTPEFANMQAETFVDEVLLGKLHAVYVVIGEDFSFGRDRRGTVDFMSNYGQPKGLNVVAVPHIKIDNIIISSTEVRERLKKGDLRGVRELTGRCPKYRGKVVKGFRRGGSLLGIPTANVELLHGELLPKTGTYAGFANIDRERFPSVIDVGVSPTFGDVKKTEMHVHILNFNRDIYGEKIDIDFRDRLRDEKKFSSVDELKAQILEDISKTKEILVDGC